MTIPEEIKEELRPTAGAQNTLLISKMKGDINYFDQIFNIALSNEYPYAWRAAWCIQKVLPKYKGEIELRVDDILKSFPNFTHHGQQGCMVKVLKSIDFDPENAGEVVDCCLEFLKDEKLPDYVKFYSMEFLVGIARKIPELKSEFAYFIEDAIPNGKTYMIKVKAKKLLQELQSK